MYEDRFNCGSTYIQCVFLPDTHIARVDQYGILFDTDNYSGMVFKLNMYLVFLALINTLVDLEALLFD